MTTYAHAGFRATGVGSNDNSMADSAINLSTEEECLARKRLALPAGTSRGATSSKEEMPKRKAVVSKKETMSPSPAAKRKLVRSSSLHRDSPSAQRSRVPVSSPKCHGASVTVKEKKNAEATSREEDSAARAATSGDIEGKATEAELVAWAQEHVPTVSVAKLFCDASSSQYKGKLLSLPVD